MPKKMIFVLLIGMLLLAACSPSNAGPIDAPVLDEIDLEVIAADDDLAQDDERMPCKTVFDYEIDPNTAMYQQIADQLPPVTEEDWAYGNPDAPITIVEYSDFQCPACGNFAQFMNALTGEFPDSLRIVYRPMPLAAIQDKAYISAMAAEAAGAQGKFWEMHDVLFQFAFEWTGLTEEGFVDWVMHQVEAFDLDVEQFKADLYDEEARKALEERTEAWLSLGVNYTPFVVINGRVFRESKPDIFRLIGIHEFGGYEECPPWVIDPDALYTARLDTDVGEIEFELFADAAPFAVNSFVFLAQNGWYDNVHFHRVLSGFVAQAGDPSGLGVIGPGYTFVNETDNDLSFDKAGVLGMANAGVDTNGSQFFITLAPALSLDGGYTIFGQVTDDSLAVLENIALRDPQTAIDFEDATIVYEIEIIKQ